MIRLGIVGCNYGRAVQLPAFRAEPRCNVVALAGRDAARTAELARAAGVAKGYGDWRALVEDPDVQAVAIATLPSLQAQICGEANGERPCERARHAAPIYARPPADHDRF